VLAAIALILTLAAGVNPAVVSQADTVEAIPQTNVPPEAIAASPGPSDDALHSVLPVTLYAVAIVFLGVVPLTVHALKAYSYAQTIGPQLVTSAVCDRLSADEVRALVAALRQSAPGTEGLVRTAIVVPAIAILGIGMLHVIATRSVLRDDAFTLAGLLTTILATVVVGCLRRSRKPTPIQTPPLVSVSDQLIRQ